MGFTIYFSNIVWDLKFLVVEVGMVPDDMVVTLFHVVLVDAQKGSGESINFCYHFVYAGRLD